MDENKEIVEIEERDATLDEDVQPEKDNTMTEEELQESLLEDSSLNALQKKCAMIKDDVWNKIQIAIGIVLGIASAVALFWNNLMGVKETAESMFSIPLIIALVLALVVPNIIEKQTARKIPKGRLVMAITLGVVVVAYFLIAGFRSGFKFTA